MKKEIWTASATLMATTVGAGILGLPYVFSRAGFFLGAIYLIFFSIVTVIINMFIVEIALRTKDQHQLIGLADRYLGKRSRTIFRIIVTLSIYGAMAAYLIGLGQSFSSLMGGSNMIWSVLSFIILAFILYYDLDTFKKSENILMLILIGVTLFLTFIAIPKVNFSNLTALNAGQWFLPYGIVLFAFMGASAIPMMKEELSDFKDFKKVIVIATAGSALLYFIFSYAMIGLMGFQVGEVATVSIGLKFGLMINALANLLAILILSTSFVALGYSLKESFFFDLTLGKKASYALMILVPIIIVLLNVVGFIDALSYVGGAANGVLLMMIIMMLQKSRIYGDREPEIKAINSRALNYAILMILALGLFSTLFL